MVELSELERDATYRFTIDQRGYEYEAVIEMQSSMGHSTGVATGIVQESEYPNGGWEDNRFRIHEDGTVDKHNDPFGPIGEVVSVEEM